MTILAVENLSKNYGALQVTDDVSFVLESGQALGIIGPNGAGKTTLFNLIAGTVTPSAGRIIFEGRDVTSLPARQRCRLGIARSFQVPHPFRGMTTYENVLTGAVFGGGLSEAVAAGRAGHVLSLLGLGGKANVPAGSLTLLDRKRLEMARALASGPKLLLLDEIAGGLTEPECQELVAAIGEIRKSGVTVVWIEHVVNALLAVVDRIAVVDFGRKIADGNPHQVMASEAVTSIYMGMDVEEAADE